MDWTPLVDARQRLQALFTGVVIVGDALSAPPAAGQEKPWLQSWIDEAKGFLRNLVKLPADKAKEAAATIKQGAEAAAEAAKEHAPDLLDPLAGIAKFAGGVLGTWAGTSIVMIALALWFLSEHGEDVAKVVKHFV